MPTPLRCRRGRRGVRTWVAGLSAIAIITGSFVGLSATVASAATTPLQMSLSSGQWAVQGKTANAFPATTTTKTGLAGTQTPTTGNITGASLTFPPTFASNTQGSSEVEFLQASPGTGTVNYRGDVALVDTLSIEVKVLSPLTETCLSTPIDVTFQSTAPYTATSKDVTLTATNFSIPTFTSTGTKGCAVAAQTLNGEFSGSTGNRITATLHGSLALAPAPTTVTTTVLSATPASPSLVSTSVTLKATVEKTGVVATGATGTVNFYAGATLLSTKNLASGTASFTTSTLPAGTNAFARRVLGRQQVHHKHLADNHLQDRANADHHPQPAVIGDGGGRTHPVLSEDHKPGGRAEIGQS